VVFELDEAGVALRVIDRGEAERREERREELTEDEPLPAPPLILLRMGLQEQNTKKSASIAGCPSHGR
jgi:hypothetical protein